MQRQKECDSQQGLTEFICTAQCMVEQLTIKNNNCTNLP